MCKKYPFYMTHDEALTLIRFIIDHMGVEEVEDKTIRQIASYMSNCIVQEMLSNA